MGEPVSEDELAVLDPDFEIVAAPDGIEGRAGYTPYEFIDFTDINLKHEVVTRVDKPISEVYALWEDRLNWPSWFTMIEEVGFQEGEEDLCALNMWYRWAMTPWLQLYVALRRTQAEKNKYILEEPVDGAPLVAAVLFQEDDGRGGTLVTLRISYLLPRVLAEYAGQIAVYGDVDRKLQGCMARMKEVVEEADCVAAAAEGAAAMAQIRADLPEHTQQQLGYEAQWEAEKQRWAAEQQQRQAAAAVAQSEAAAAAPPAQAEAPAGVAAEPEPAAKPKRTPRRASSKEATVASGKARRAKGSRAAQSADGA
ncbi:cyclase dehydrase [Micractinium conductrix]|uniref:Cyclase dehydrase n=1 Tax=Micractinium conductrix TaxID=554055 RepID=A0A2P6V9S8_9CHLO|nr:cyclase dehydrase [Micractinium conductrix]|eukprot:PSC70811.1 cyclase dehydrase [Micractinium conductrix]